MQEKIKTLIRKVSYKGRFEKKMVIYKKKKDECEKMNCDELNLKYIEVQTRYQYIKNLTLAVIVIFLTTIIMSAWKGLVPNFVKVFAAYENMNLKSVDVLPSQVLLMLYSLIIIFCIILIFIFFKTFRKVTEEKIFMESYLKMKQRGKWFYE